jgi:hypothetical protein
MKALIGIMIILVFHIGIQNVLWATEITGHEPQVEMIIEKDLKQDETQSWLRRNILWVLLGVAVIAGGAAAAAGGGGGSDGNSGGTVGELQVNW